MIFGEERALVLRQPEIAGISVSRYVPHYEFPKVQDGLRYRLSEDWHESFIEHACHQSEVKAGGIGGGGGYDELGHDLGELKDDLYLDVDVGPSHLVYDWDRIGSLMGFDGDEVELMKAKAEGHTRERMGRHLLWDENKVHAVWKRVYRKLEKPETAEMARGALFMDGVATSRSGWGLIYEYSSVHFVFTSRCQESTLHCQD